MPAMNEPVYTEDWFSMLIPSWTEMLTPRLPRDASILEIGAFEGRSARWLMETFPRAQMTTIDPFDEILGRPGESASILLRFTENLAPFSDRCTLMRERSRDVLPRFLVTTDCRYDFIYVDGSHWAHDVIFDAVCGFRLLRVGGVMCFDDFYWSDKSVPHDQSPQPAITAFLTSHVGKVKLIAPVHRQVWVENVQP